MDRNVRLAASYLARQVRDDGRFVYRVHLDGHPLDAAAYNVLRHAGALYALAEFQRRTPDTNGMDAVGRGLRYLRRRYVRPVGGRGRMLAVFSDPTEERCTWKGSPVTTTPVAKLGATGLALAAMTSVHRLAPKAAPIDELRRLGRFLLWMQLPNGRFCTLFRAGQRDAASWSLYYPGEACFGLARLYGIDRDRRWLGAAARGALHVVKEQMRRRRPPPDHWLLIATAAMWPYLDALRGGAEARRLLLDHCCRIAEGMLAEQSAAAERGAPAGAFDRFARSAVAATRIEGLLALRSILPAGRAELARRIDAAVEAGVRFLLRCQVTEGPARGAVVRSPRRVQPGRGIPVFVAARHNRLRRTVRVDYVQHVLCALMQYEEVRRARENSAARGSGSTRTGAKGRSP